MYRAGFIQRKNVSNSSYRCSRRRLSLASSLCRWRRRHSPRPCVASTSDWDAAGSPARLAKANDGPTMIPSPCQVRELCGVASLGPAPSRSLNVAQRQSLISSKQKSKQVNALGPGWSDANYQTNTSSPPRTS